MLVPRRRSCGKSKGTNMRNLTLATLVAATALAAPVLAAPVMMSSDWAKDACDAWNKDPVLTDKLVESGWMKNDGGRNRSLGRNGQGRIRPDARDDARAARLRRPEDGGDEQHGSVRELPAARRQGAKRIGRLPRQVRKRRGGAIDSADCAQPLRRRRELLPRGERIRRVHQRRPAAHVNGHAECFLDLGFGRAELRKRLHMKADAGIAMRGDAERKRDQLLRLALERAVAGCRVCERAERFRYVGRIRAQRRKRRRYGPGDGAIVLHGGPLCRLVVSLIHRVTHDPWSL